MAFLIAQPLPYTLLSLPEYAQIMGVNPVHFAGAATATIWPIQGGGGRNACEDIWHRYSWQAVDSISHYDIAEAIQSAEYEIARELGYWPAPMWTSQELHQFSRHHRPDVYRYGQRNVRGQEVSTKTVFGKIIAGGRRATTANSTETAKVADGTLEYEDLDTDEFFETATITLPTTFTDATQVKVYFHDYGGIQEWEIRPCRSKTIALGVFTAVFDSWLFIDPDLMAAYPTTADPAAIDITTVANYVDEVDVYREYNDPTQNSAELYWEPTPNCTICSGAGCPACTLTVQDGCIHIRDANRGFVVPAAATYDDTNAQWDSSSLALTRDPDFVKVWYYSGALSQEYLGGRWGWTLPRKWARTIAYLATARLERPFCSCGTATALAKHLREDLSAMSSQQQQARSYQIDSALVLQNPFGTHRGEVMAWQQIINERDRSLGGGAA